MDALVDSEEAYRIYRFLELLEDGDDDAREVRDKLAAIGLDEGTYTAATKGEVEPALKAARAAARAAEKKRKVEEDAAAAAADETSSKRSTRGRRGGGLRNFN